MLALSGPSTLVLMAHGNGAAPGVHKLRGRFYELALQHFEAAQLVHAAAADHPGCQIHCLVRRAAPETTGVHARKKARR